MLPKAFFVFLLLIQFTLSPIITWAQDNKMLQADDNFQKENYREALSVFLSKDQEVLKDPYLKYKIGVCYFYSSNHKLKGKPYFDYALKYKTDTVPVEVYYYLGRLAHLDYRFTEAINYYNEYLEYAGSSPLFTDAHVLIKMCDNGIRTVDKQKERVAVNMMEVPVNTSYDDYSPVISSRENMMLFSSGRLKDSYNHVLGNEYVYLPKNIAPKGDDIYMTYRHGLNWSQPYPQMDDFEGNKRVPLYLSPNGSHILFYMEGVEDDFEGAIYESKVKKGRWTKPRKLSNKINSKYKERGVCLANNGQTMYFSSNRPGGYGGFDIYKTVRVGRNDWSNPINLGPTINTEADEVNPFMQSDNKTLYFSANGKKSIGGFDIFVTARKGAIWTQPKNVGYPINSTYDDNHFVQVPSRKYAYFASNRINDNSVGGFDIYHVFKPEKKFNRTMVTGTIIAKRGEENVPLSLKVADVHNNKIEKYIYNPDLKTGRFFMILSPKKSYSIKVCLGESELYRLTIDIPEETYNYELHQRLNLYDIELLGNIIGHKVSPDGSSFRITRLSEMEKVKSMGDMRYDALLLLLDMIVDRTDKDGLSSLNEFDDVEPEVVKDPNAPDEYFTPLIDIIERAFNEVNPDLIYPLRDMRGDVGDKFVFQNSSQLNGQEDIVKHDLWFASNSYELTEKQKSVLREFADFVRVKDPNTKLQVLWFRQDKALGVQKIDELTEMRVNSIHNYLDRLGINRSQYTTTSHFVKSNDEDWKNKVALKLYRPVSN